MASDIRTGRVSSIDYPSGTYEVTYKDRGKSVTRRINAMSNGEYKMPRVGQIVSVSHNGNGVAAATTTGSIWNKSNPPAEGHEGLFRKEYADETGQAYERYDAKTGIYTQFTDKRTGRTCKGEIFDEAGGPITQAAGGAVQIKSSGSSVSIHGKTGVGLGAEKTVSIDAGENVSLEAGGDLDIGVDGETSETHQGKVTRVFQGGIESEVSGEVKLTINGVSITIGPGGDITVEAPGSISVTAQQISLTGASNLTL